MRFSGRFSLRESTGKWVPRRGAENAVSARDCHYSTLIPRELHHLSPFLGFLGDELGEVRRATRPTARLRSRPHAETGGVEASWRLPCCPLQSITPPFAARACLSIENEAACRNSGTRCSNALLHKRA